MLRPIQHIVNAIVQIGGCALLFAALLVTYDVITRKLLNISIAGADEITGYVFAVSTACAYSYALLTRANIRIDIVYNKLPATIQRYLDVLNIALVAGFFAIICYYAYGLVSDAITYSSRSITPLQVPLAIPQSLWFAGLCFALLTAVVLLVLALSALLKGRHDRVSTLVGIPSLKEEIEIELHPSGSEESNDNVQKKGE